MSASNLWQGVKSQIPIIKSGSSEPKSESPDRRGKTWAEKLKKRSSSTLSLFNVTHKVPSHIVSPKSPKEVCGKLPTDCNNAPQYSSNMELSKCWTHLGESLADNSGLSRSSVHGSEQDLSLTWWQKKPPPPKDALNPSVADPIQKSASITNIFDDKGDTVTCGFSDNSSAPMSLPGAHIYRDNSTSCQDLSETLSHQHSPGVAMNCNLKTQFRSEQNLYNSAAPYHDSGRHSLDYGYANRGGTLGKFNFDISTIKELPEDRSDSPAKALLWNEINGFSDVANDQQILTSAATAPTSFGDMYRSLQDLSTETSSDFAQPMSLAASQCNIVSQTIPEDSVHELTPFLDNTDCFRSVQDLRDTSSFSTDYIPFSMDYQSLNKGGACASAIDLSTTDPPMLSLPVTNGGQFVSKDLSVSLMDIGSKVSADDNKMLTRRQTSRIPKRRHTVSVQDLRGILPELKGSSSRSISTQNLANSSDLKTDRKYDDGLCSEKEHSRNFEKSSGKSASDRNSSVDRKKGCVGCRHKRERKPVSRQHSLPPVKVKHAKYTLIENLILCLQRYLLM